jgi:hypothetical protein
MTAVCQTPPVPRLLRAPAALALLLPLAACGGGSHPAPVSSGPATPSAAAHYSATPADFAAVRRLLAAQSAAILHHDETAYLATVDAGFRPTATTFYDNVTALGVSALSYSVGTAGVVPAPIPGGDPTLAPELVEHLQVRGAMTAPTANRVDMTFVRRDGHWLLGAETVSTDVYAYDQSRWRPWFGAPISVARAGRVVALVDRGSGVGAASLAHTMSADLASDAALLGVPATTPVLVDGTSNGAGMTLDYVTGERAGAQEMAIFASHGLGPAYAVAGHVIAADPGHVSQLLRDRVTDRHELTHLLLSSRDGDAPTWVTEGIAEYVAAYPGVRTFNEEMVGRTRLMRMPHQLPSSGAFGEDSHADYAIAAQAVRWLVQTYGMPRLLDLLDAFRRDWRGSPDLGEAEALQQTDGVTLRQVADGAWSDIARLPS